MYQAPPAAVGAFATGRGAVIAAGAGGYPVLFGTLAALAALAIVIALAAGGSNGAERSAVPSPLVAE